MGDLQALRIPLASVSLRLGAQTVSHCQGVGALQGGQGKESGQTQGEEGQEGAGEKERG